MLNTLEGNISDDNNSTPDTFEEAWVKPVWKDAIVSEYNSLIKNQTWILEPLPSDRKPVKCK